MRQFVDRSTLSFEPAYRGVVVDGDDQPIAELARLVEVADVASVEDVETAVGEDDARALPPGEPDGLGKLATIGRGWGDWHVVPKSRVEFGQRHGGGTCLGAYQGAGDVGQACTVRPGPPSRRANPEGGRHGVAGTRRVVDLDAERGQVLDATVGLEQRQPAAAPGQGDGVDAARPSQCRTQLPELRVARPTTDGLAELAKVRLEQVGSPVFGETLELGIDDRADALRRGEDALRTIDCPLVIVLDDQGVLAGHMTCDALGDFDGGGLGQRRLEVHPRDLLAHAHHPFLEGGSPTVDGYQVGLDAGGVEQIGYRGSVRVVTDGSDQGAAGTQRDHVQGDVGSAAQAVLRAIDLHDRHRRFRGNALRSAEEIAIEHDVPDDEDVDIGVRGKLAVHCLDATKTPR